MTILIIGKYSMLKLFISLWLFISTLAFANSNNDNGLFTIKLYFEPNKKFNVLSYCVTIPKNSYYSLYLGSDLPTWKVVKQSNTLKGDFHPVELVNIRVHGNSTGAVLLKISDEVHSRIVWRGKINYSNFSHQFNIDTQRNNLYYNTKITTDREPQTVWVEMGI